ncbi:glycyl-tRNA synthetase beta chain [Oikeobacillus pervagus]|uniref:Glycine--tRNA ligase beta subunit n=1 Tax=Oikeobacillus pervagus TaxID=1325931 RepID=A0AAJ1SW92_9BACI|nr:glycine--tRNA ligase subunit beta [Oikeobacillus pervagus]MDQ0213910.1 glycyl-tRNA synthetase beta chain [Oikeobacillus pervagus]
MSKQDLLLEIGLEELPARFVTESMKQLGRKIESFLSDLKIPYGEVTLYSTPRRLAVLIQDVAEAQEDIHEEVKGPAKKVALNEKGEWSKAAIGFTKGKGMTTEDIYFKELKGVEYAFVNKFVKGQKTIDLLPQLKEIITGMTFGKNMRWANNNLKFVRPIKWLVALFGGKIIPFSITNVHTDRISFGHRFLGEKVEITSPTEYESILKAQYVIVNSEERKQMIVKQLHDLEEKNQWAIPIDEDLLEEVNNLVEYPTALSGHFNKQFLELPEEVLITSMKEHQRYFPVKNKENRLLANFVTVRNGNDYKIETVARGNEKVLSARLADADFFFKEDQETSIESSLNKLSSIVYHEKIGTLSEKVNRIRRIASELGKLLHVDSSVQQKIDRAAELSKFDLVTHMVYEFPELQGVMGEKYALQKGEDVEVAKAINEHYQPRSADDVTPSTTIGAVVSIADKLDTICSCFAIDIIPTGSQDPYALRRQSTGIVQTMLDQKWELTVEDILKVAITIVAEDQIGSKSNVELLQELVSFFKLRVKHILQEKDVRYDMIDAVLDGEIGSVPSVLEKSTVLMNRKDKAHFKETIEALSRVINISKKANVETVNPDLFENEYEHELYREYQQVEEKWNTSENAEVQFELLESLKPAINQYFDHTMVMADNESLKNNRLAFMLKLSKLVQAFANMNAIIVK